MATKINPPVFNSKSKPYELYKHELLAWSEITELAKEKKGIAIALTLPEEDETKIREKVFEQIKLEDLKKESGFKTLLEFLDKHLASQGQSMNEFIAIFDSKYRKIEKKKMTLPSEILAFKLLRKANITKEQKMLVLTGMNYENKATLYEEAKKPLKKFMGEGCHTPCDSKSIKLEPAF